MVNGHYDQLLEQYRFIWKNRLFLQKASSEEIIKDAIIRELKDENTHPRVRKNKYIKFYSAIKRIENSELDNDAKIQLIKLHIDIMDNFLQN